MNLDTRNLAPEEVSTLNMVLKYAGEGDSAVLWGTQLDWQPRYWRAVMTADMYDDDGDRLPDAHVPQLELLATDPREALEKCPHPWQKLYGMYVAPELEEHVRAMLQESGRSFEDWFWSM